MRTLLIAGMACALCSLLHGQNKVSLLENSPFMPPGKQAGADSAADKGPASLAKLQLRGITSINGEYIFSVYNPDTRESKWIPQGVEEDGVVIKSYNPNGNSVVIHSESENLSRQMELNDYSKPTGIRGSSVINRPVSQPTRSATSAAAVSPTGTAVTRTAQAVQRPTRRNLETLRARRAELAEKLRKQPKPGTNQQEQSPGQTQNRTPSR